MNHPVKPSNEYDVFFTDLIVNVVCTFMKCMYNSPGSSVEKEHSLQKLSMSRLIKL